MKQQTHENLEQENRDGAEDDPFMTSEENGEHNADGPEFLKKGGTKGLDGRAPSIAGDIE